MTRNPHGTLNYTTDTPDPHTCTLALAAACKPFDAMTDETVAKGAAGGWFELLQAARALLRAEGVRE